MKYSFLLDYIEYIIGIKYHEDGKSYEFSCQPIHEERIVQTGIGRKNDMVTKELKEEGFGILTEIDVTATLKEKLDVNFKKYKILGACNLPYAYQTLHAEDKIGVVLPRNVIV